MSPPGDNTPVKMVSSRVLVNLHLLLTLFQISCAFVLGKGIPVALSQSLFRRKWPEQYLRAFTIEVGDDESDVSIMRRFKKEVNVQGYLTEMRARSRHESKAMRLRRKIAVRSST